MCHTYIHSLAPAAGPKSMRNAIVPTQRYWSKPTTSCLCCFFEHVLISAVSIWARSTTRKKRMVLGAVAINVLWFSACCHGVMTSCHAFAANHVEVSPARCQEPNKALRSLGWGLVNVGYSRDARESSCKDGSV